MMKPALLLLLLALSQFGFGQDKTADYTIYSAYLKIYQKSKNKQFNYAIRESMDRGQKNNLSTIVGMLGNFRSYLKDNSDASMFFQCEYFRDTLKKDTLWLPLIEQLNQMMMGKHIIQNRFSNDLKVTVFADYRYLEYFDRKTSGDIEEGWAAFHDDYPGYSLLTELSPIANDGKRAVFYFSTRCGSLCGTGQFVLFYKDDKGWRFVGILPIWMA